MWQRLTVGARRVVFFAQEEAARLGENYVSTEHLLLGLVRENDNIAVRLLDRLGVSANRIRSEIEVQVTRGDGRLGQDMQLSPDGKRVIDLAYEEARQLSNEYIGTEHLLLGLIREGDGLAGRVLAKLGVELERTRGEVNIIQDTVPAAESQTAKSTRSETTSVTAGDIASTLHKYSVSVARNDRHLAIGAWLEEIDRATQNLMQRTNNSVILLGESSIAKTTIVETLANRIAGGEVPALGDRRIVLLEMDRLVSTQRLYGQATDLFTEILSETRNSNRKVILYIDTLYLLGAPAPVSGILAGFRIFKSAMMSGEVSCILGATAPEFQRLIEADAELERRFQIVRVSEPSTEEAVEILKALRESYETHHRVRITDGALRMAVEFTDRYRANRRLLEDAIDLVDEAASRLRREHEAPPPELRQARHRLAEVQKANHADVHSASGSDTDSAALKAELNRQIEDLARIWKQRQADIKPVVTEADVAAIVQSRTGLPGVSVANHILLCCEPADSLPARDLHRRLQHEGFLPILAPDSLLPGYRWQEVVRTLVRSSRVALLCLSHRSVSEGDGSLEQISSLLDAAGKGPEEDLVSMVVRLDDCEVPDRFRSWQRVDLFEPEGYDNLLRSLSAAVRDGG